MIGLLLSLSLSRLKLMPKLRRQKGVKVVEVLGYLLDREIPILVLICRGNQSICFRFMFVVGSNQQFFEFLSVEVPVIVLVQVVVKVSLVSLVIKSM